MIETIVFLNIVGRLMKMHIISSHKLSSFLWETMWGSSSFYAPHKHLSTNFVIFILLIFKKYIGIYQLPLSIDCSHNMTKKSRRKVYVLSELQAFKHQHHFATIFPNIILYSNDIA